MLHALFRHGAGWAVFREEAGRALLTPVKVGRRGADTVQVLGGIADGARVVLYPGNRLAEAVRIAPRRPP
ncbi:hypothetical protein ACN9JG_20785 (plasmid) [Cereibacter azotoformans]|uniref:hypothetical protein n=1 Tax=Cereibacter TaxID=1653176 RepID=UPI00119CE37E|nr:hypothetical protein [Cereibacter sediminicola]